jgi:acyl-[acyl-carrier-protein]-phospholipid O-acyltransferase/long-chain-fatty-acid--[acyl-carrier-protein] ligase
VNATRETPSESVPLSRNVSFLGMTVAQFLGAFNDNLFKQVVLLQCIDHALRGGPDRQPWAQGLFALPFVLFSGFAGFLSDKFDKRSVVVTCKVAEIAIMAIGTFVVAREWLPGALAILFLMGTHSAFFGPSKYGILPELVPPSQLPRANGLFLMTTFLGIILGTGLAGLLKSILPTTPWACGAAFMGVALVGTLAARFVRSVPPASPSPKFDPQSLFVSAETRRLILSDPPLRTALLVSSLFWFCGGVVQPTVNAVGKQHVFAGLPDAEKDIRTSLLVSCLAIGIAIGCPLAGAASRGRADFRLTVAGAWGIVACLLLLALAGGAGPPGPMLEQPIRLLLVLLGTSTGFFTVPLQVFLQSRPPASQKGRVIGAMNLIQWVGILLAAVFYLACNAARNALDWPVSTLFAATALAIVPVGLFFRPWRGDQQP